MSLDEKRVSETIIRRYADKLTECLRSDVAIVGAGPSGLVAAYYLAKAGVNTVVFEKKLSTGGGIWGGGMLFSEIVVQKPARHILDEFKITYTERDNGLLAADAVHVAAALCYAATTAGATVLNTICVEDVMVRDGKVTGLVVNWTPVEMANLHVDPLAFEARMVIDATGHDCSVAHMLVRKEGLKLLTETGTIMGERSMWAEDAERAVVENTAKVFESVYVAGMAANAAFGGHRMGPVFGGMLLSGEKVAELVMKDLGK